MRRESAEWEALYRMRQAVERVFKSLKQSRRLEAHCVRGLKRVALHCAMTTTDISSDRIECVFERYRDGRHDMASQESSIEVTTWDLSNTSQGKPRYSSGREL